MAVVVAVTTRCAPSREVTSAERTVWADAGTRSITTQSRAVPGSPGPSRRRSVSRHAHGDCALAVFARL